MTSLLVGKSNWSWLTLKKRGVSDTLITQMQPIIFNKNQCFDTYLVLQETS